MTTRLVVQIVWGLMAFALVAWQAVAWASRRRLARLGEAVQTFVQRPVRRVLTVIGWMWLGWHFFAR